MLPLDCGWLCALFAGYAEWTFIAKFYAIFVIATTVNFLRALGSHRYTNQGGEMRYVDQLLDSTTIEGWPIVTELMAPLGCDTTHYTIWCLRYLTIPWVWLIGG